MATAAFTPFHRGGSGSPLLLLHGFTDTWRTWELVIPALEEHHDVLALTLPGHSGGPVLSDVSAAGVLDAVEQAMDDAGMPNAHIVGNSLGGFVALALAARARARSVVAFAPAGGWAVGDESFRDTLAMFKGLQELLQAAAPYADAIVSNEAGRRQATQLVTVKFEHIPPELLVHQIRGAADCPAVLPLIEAALRDGWHLEADKITCPVRIVWGTQDQVLVWPSTAARFVNDWLPNADWVELEGVGHCPQLDVPVEAAQLITGFTS